MLKKMTSLLLAVMLLLSATVVLDPEGSKASAADPVYRALCIGNVDYGQGMDLPGCDTDAIAMMTVLKQDPRYKKVYGYKNIKGSGNYISGDPLVGTTSTFAQMVQKAYSGAAASDVNLFYFSGHSSGVDKNGEAGLVLLDGTVVTAKQLKSYLDKNNGRKLVILDMCNAGNMIGKGEENNQAFIDAFLDEVATEAKAGELATSNYYVLAASSTTEYSWTSGSSLDASRVMGAFTSKLVQGLGDQDSNRRIMADENINGNVTMDELFAYTSRNNRWSKTQVYPQTSSLSVFRYTVTNATKPLVTGAKVTPTSGPAPYKLSFTLNADANIDVTVVAVTYAPQKNNPVSYVPIVNSVKNGYSAVKAGSRSYTWDGKASAGNSLVKGDYYFVVHDKTMGTLLFYPFVRNTTLATLKISGSSSLKLGGGREAAISVAFTQACALNVNVYDSSGKKVRVLAKDDPGIMVGRAQEEDRENKNVYYWNGKDDNGTNVKAGTYTVKAQGANNKGSSNTVSFKIKITT